MPFIDVSEGGPAVRISLPKEVAAGNGHRFELRGAIKGGGNGVVFRAWPGPVLGKEIDVCAVKLLRRLDAQRRDRFSNEIRILGILNNDHISQIFGHGEISIEEGDATFSVPWLAMELGEDNLRRHVQTVGVLTPAQLKQVSTDMCLAMGEIHGKGIIHRDLKPDNFVWADDGQDSVLMIDFGIAKLMEEDVSGRPLDQFTRTMEFVGPVFFSSPELIAYASDKTTVVDHRSDIFQFAKTLWFLATGRITAGIPSKSDCPFDGALHAIVMECLPDDPEDRLQNAVEVLRRLTDDL